MRTLFLIISVILTTTSYTFAQLNNSQVLISSPGLVIDGEIRGLLETSLFVFTDKKDYITMAQYGQAGDIFNREVFKLIRTISDSSEIESLKDEFYKVDFKYEYMNINSNHTMLLQTTNPLENMCKNSDGYIRMTINNRIVYWQLSNIDLSQK